MVLLANLLLMMTACRRSRWLGPLEQATSKIRHFHARVHDEFLAEWVLRFFTAFF